MAEDRALSLCQGFNELATPDNENPDVTAYSGLFLSLDTKAQPLEITTIELDIRRDLATDLSVKVYTKTGQYLQSTASQTEWNLVAESTLVADGTRHLIPASDFVPVTVDSYKRQSFYITLAGPWIDNNVNALIRMGELVYENDHLALMAGSGTLLPDFPVGGVDTSTAPILAGAVHYRVDPVNCSSESPPPTHAEYRFTLETPSIDSGMFNAILAAVAEAIDAELSHNNNLVAYRDKYDLQRVIDVAGYIEPQDGECTNGRPYCPSLTVGIDFIHSVDLDSDLLLYDLYRLVERLSRAVARSIEPSVTYSGFKDVAANYVLTLRSTPDSGLMNEAQREFFVVRTKEYLNKALEETQGSKVLEVEIGDQIPVGRRLRALQSNGLLITGRVLGLELYEIPDQTFADNVLVALWAQQGLYVEYIKSGLLEPNDLNVGSDYQLFQNINGIETEITLYQQPEAGFDLSAAPTTAPTAAGTLDSDSGASGFVQTSLDALKSVDPYIWSSVGVAVGILSLTISVLWRCHRSKRVPRQAEPDPESPLSSPRRRQSIRSKPEFIDVPSSVMEAAPKMIVISTQGANQTGSQVREAPRRSRSYDGLPLQHHPPSSPPMHPNRSPPPRSKSSDSVAVRHAPGISTQPPLRTNDSFERAVPLRSKSHEPPLAFPPRSLPPVQSHSAAERVPPTHSRSHDGKMLISPADQGRRAGRRSTRQDYLSRDPPSRSNSFEDSHDSRIERMQQLVGSHERQGGPRNHSLASTGGREPPAVWATVESPPSPREPPGIPAQRPAGCSPSFEAARRGHTVSVPRPDGRESPREQQERQGTDSRPPSRPTHIRSFDETRTEEHQQEAISQQHANVPARDSPERTRPRRTTARRLEAL